MKGYLEIMDEETLRKIQMIELEIAKEIKRICDMNNINYFLDGGSLLGAVRHNGFIPWDDDFDIGMLREDYEKFLLIANYELSEKYVLQTMHNEKNYGLVFAKVRKKDTLFLEEKSSSNLCYNGIFIDIFPYDAYPKVFIQQKKQKITLNILKRLIISKSGHKPWIEKNKISIKKWIIYLPIRCISFFVSKSFLINKYDQGCTIYNSFGNGKVFPNGISNYGKFYIDKEVVVNTEEHIFEDVLFKIPIGYDQFLRTLYGDYLELPPEEERYNRHGVVQIQF